MLEYQQQIRDKPCQLIMKYKLITNEFLAPSSI